MPEKLLNPAAMQAALEGQMNETNITLRLSKDAMRLLEMWAAEDRRTLSEYVSGIIEEQAQNELHWTGEGRNFVDDDDLPF